MKRLSLLAFSALLFAQLPRFASAQVSIVTTGSYTQNFNTLASSGTGNTWTNNSTIANWYTAASGGTSLSAGPIPTYNAGTGSSNTGALYSFGTAAADRALGSVASGGTGTVYYGVLLRNNSGQALSELTIAYTGEQWRAGNPSPAATHSLTFSYRISSTPITDVTSGSYTNVAALNFNGPITGGPAGALDGNAPANRTAISYVLSSITIPDGHYIILRWTDVDNASFDHGLAIDDLTVSWEIDILPVTLLDFKGTREGSASRLSWATAQEENNLGFAIERSYNGEAFEQIGFVAGAGNSSATLGYDYLDYTAESASVISNVIYYRLRQIDLDGTISYSPTITLSSATAAPALRAYPNPTAGTLHLEAAGLDPAASATLEVFSPEGRTLLAFTGSLGDVLSATEQGFPTLAPGAYTLALVAEGQLLRRVVLKQ